jgi:DNA-binding NtrC family response regulator
MSAEKDRGGAAASEVSVAIGGRTFTQAMRDCEAQYLAACLEAAGCNQRKAAERAGLNYETFRRKVSGLKVKYLVVIEKDDAA